MNYFGIKAHPKLLFLFCLFSLQIMSFAQNSAKISIVRNNITIKDALTEVEKQSKMSVAYNESKLKSDKVINIDITNQPLNEALNTILANTGFSYQLKNEYIIIVPQNEQQDKGKEILISGNIIDESDLPLIGATVSVKGTKTGTVADLDGNFSLTVPKGSVLTVSFMGYLSQNITVGDKSTYAIKMVPDSKSLEAVVVTALGIKRAQKALSYNVQEIGSDELTKAKDANLINSLAGKVAGVTINSGSAGVGSASKVVMRGSKSIEQSNNALYVIDGIPMYNMGGGSASGGRGDEFGSTGTSEAIADINPEDVASISVLTGAAAAALYGNQGANGAIIITTKRGSADKLEVAFSSGIELSNPFVLPRFQNRYGTGDLASDGGSTIRSWGNKLVPENSYGYSPRKDFFETGTIFTNAVSVSTGTAKNQTYFSAAVINSDGIVPNNQYDRYNFTFRNTAKFLQDKMTLDIGGNYIIQKDQNMTNNGVYANPISSAYLFPRGDDFDMARVFERYDPAEEVNVQYWPQGEGDFRLQNPYWVAYRNLKNNNKKRYMFNVALSYDVLDWLNLVGHVRVDNTHNTYTEKYYASTNRTISGKKGQYLIDKSDSQQTYADFLANINKRINDFSFVVNIGTSITDLKYDGLKVEGPIREDGGRANYFNVFQLDRNIRQDSQDGWGSQSQAVFASAEVGYKSTYYLTLTARNDWESALANTESPSFFYPSVGVSTILSEIIPFPKQIDYVKIRGSLASVGSPIARNISIPSYGWDSGRDMWETVTVFPIRKFKPERTTSWEVGLTTRFLQNFNLDLSWYYTNTTNQTFQPQISVSSGYKTMYIQTGSVRNTGIEAGLGYTNKWSNFNWASNVVFSLNRNKINELVKNAIHPETGELINKDRLDIGGLGRASFILKPGGTLGDLYSTQDLRRDENGYIYVDANGDIQSKNSDDIFLGSVFPKFNTSWRNDFGWKDFSLSFMVSARVGGVVYSATQAALDAYGVSENSALARDNGGVIINGGDLISANTWYKGIGSSDGLPQYYTYSATNVRLQEVSFGYTFPKKMTKIGTVSVSAVGKNLWMIYSKAPFDPEAVATSGNYFQGIDHFMMPSLRNIGFNLRVKF